MRLNYLNNGGHDQHVLNKFTEMEYNARFKNGDRTLTASVNRPLPTSNYGKFVPLISSLF